MLDVTAPPESQVSSTLVPAARPPSLKLIQVSRQFVGVFDASLVLPYRPRFTRPPLGMGSVHAKAGSPASIITESSAAGSKTNDEVAGLNRPPELFRW